MALMAVLESDLRALSAEARRRYPAVKDAAEHAILKLRSLSSSNEVAHNVDILRIFLMACNVKSVRLSVIGLSCLQKLISHDAVAQSALKEVLSTLKDHAEMTDETVQLKTLQTILIIFQSHLHPENENDMAQALGICLRLLESNRSSDSVHNTAAATFRQAVALVFDNVANLESLPSGKMHLGSQATRTSSVTDDVSRNINQSAFQKRDVPTEPRLQEGLSRAGKLALLLLEDLTALAAGGSAIWLRVHALQRIFALDILEFILSNYVAIFQTLAPYQQVLRHQICSLLMTSLRTNIELEGESGEPTFRRLVLRSVAHVIRLYSLYLVTESEVFLNILVNVTRLDLPLWHRILVLEVLRGFCVEVRTLGLLFQNFDMDPKNTNVVENMVKSLARVVSSIQVVSESSEESLAAVAGMFSSKAKGIEWSMDDASNAAVVVASEAHAITLAVEGLLGVVFTVATLTDEAVDVGEIESPKSDDGCRAECSGNTAVLCKSMVDSTWLTILDALSLILARSQGEAIILEILKGYQAFTQACGVLHAVEPLNSFLASLCKFTINIPNDVEKRSVLVSPGSKKLEPSTDQRDNIVLTPKNVQALRTLFNVAHRLHNVLGPSWVLVLETLAALDRAIHSPHASTQEVATSVSRIIRDTSGQYADFHILSSLNSQLFESSAMMHVSAVKSLLSALRQLSSQFITRNINVMGQASNQHTGSVAFSVERMTSILVNNLHRVQHIWDQVIDHLIELADIPNQLLRNLALDSLDQSICAVLGSEEFQGTYGQQFLDSKVEGVDVEVRSSFECEILSPLVVLYKSSQSLDVRAGALKILLHVLERHGEKLCYSWPQILEMLRGVADASEKDLIPLGFQSIRVIMNDGLSSIPVQCLDLCIEVTGAYGGQKMELNISLTAIGLLWTATDFIAKGLVQTSSQEKAETEYSLDAEFNLMHDHNGSEHFQDEQVLHKSNNVQSQIRRKTGIDYNRLLSSVFSILQTLGADERPEVRNSAIRTLFQTLGSHGQKISITMWEDCLWNYVFPILDRVSQLAATSSKDEWQGKELGTRGGKAVHMLIHHSRNTAQKQWDETLVLVLGGITRLLRSFFPFLQSLRNFSAGWDRLLNFIKDSILYGSKEVGLAAISCLQTVVSSQCPKGNLALSYIKSMLDVYELVLERSPDYRSNAANKVKQEVLHGLGDLYVQAQRMFDADMYLQLLAVLQRAIRNSTCMADVDNEIETIPPLHRTVLEILPLLRPTDHLSSMWPLLLQELLYYLLGSEAPSPKRSEVTDLTSNMSQILDGIDLRSHVAVNLQHKGSNTNTNLEGVELKPKHDVLDAASIVMARMGPSSPHPDEVPSDDIVVFSWSQLFAEKLVPIIIELFLETPSTEKCSIVPEIVQGLGRCMGTRRDNPNGSLWRLAVDGFNRVLVDDLSRVHMDYKKNTNVFKLARVRFWKEVADVYETFLVGSCGRALSCDATAEALEMNFLSVLGDKILKGQIDASIEIVQRMVTTLDRCASRIGSLPLESVGLMPSHCSRFSLSCLQLLFSLCSCTSKESWSPARSEVSKVSIPILMNRCQLILNQFLLDENNLGESSLPTVRVEETVCVLKELARLVIDFNTAAVLPLQTNLKVVGLDESPGGRAHLLLLFPSFCELVVTRESRIRELVQVLLKLIACELGLQKAV